MEAYKKYKKYTFLHILFCIYLFVFLDGGMDLVNTNLSQSVEVLHTTFSSIIVVQYDCLLGAPYNYLLSI